MLVACGVIQSTRAGSVVVCSRCEEGAARAQPRTNTRFNEYACSRAFEMMVPESFN